MSIGTPAAEVEYPAEDGQPMAETTLHVRAITLLHQALEDFLLPRAADTLIASDLFWYYEEGNPAARVAPDVMVVRGVAPGDRRSFFSWREPRPAPAAVFEMASEGTWREDRREKFRLYQELGVYEYFLFDPEARYLNPPALGYRLRHNDYVPIMEEPDDSLASVLGFRVRAEGEMLRLIDAATGEPVPTRAERADRERSLAEQERRRVEEERRRADAERERAAREKERADRLEAEVERLKALLRDAGGADGAGP